MQSAVYERGGRYDTLFRGELPYEPIPEDAQVGISGLCRATRRAGRRDSFLNDHLNQLPLLIDEILVDHDLRAMSGEEAIFSFIEDKDREEVSAVVSETFKLWEIAQARNKLDFLITNPKSESKWLVVEAAAAVIQAAETRSFDLSNKRSSADLAKIIACWGPKFVKEWFNYTILNQWMEQEKLPIEDQNEWREIFTPGILKHFAVDNINDPLSALKRVKHILENVLTIPNISQELGWSEAETAEMFTPGILKHFAVGNINDPLGALKRVKHILENVLTIPNISQELGWSEAETEEMFPPSILKRFAVHNINDPLKGCIEWVKGNSSMGKDMDRSRDNKLNDRLVAKFK